MKLGSLWNYYRDEIDYVDDNGSDGKSFEYKTKIIGKTKPRPQRPDPDQQGNQDPQSPIPPLNTEVVVPLTYLSNFWRYLDFPLINCEIELELKWTRNCVLIEEYDNITGISFTIATTMDKIYETNSSFHVK